MEVNEKELEWMYYGLMAQRALRDSPTTVPVWAEWKQKFLNKVNYERYWLNYERTELGSSLEEEP